MALVILSGAMTTPGLAGRQNFLPNPTRLSIMCLVHTYSVSSVLYLSGS